MASSSSSSPEISSAMAAEPAPRFSYKDATQEEVLDDLSSRFILNLPDEELVSLERLCFQVEQAHWFYEDFIREENTKLPSLALKKFSEMLFHACPLLQQWSHDHEQAFNTFMQYKTRVPVCGAIMLNDAMDKCVLVKGWKASSGWGFPKGKINETEPPHVCAIREVLEETGYNLASQLNPNDVFELSIKEQKISLYVVPGVPEDFPFKTKTRKEISKIEWFKLTDLPTWRKNKASPGRFYLISPFIAPLKAFIQARKSQPAVRKTPKQKKRQPVAPPIVPKEELPDNGHDPIQESSSQSSVDNPGPLTPSPQEPSRAINTVSDMAELDPHFARLLSSLTMSATGHSEIIQEMKDNNGNTYEQQIFDSSSANNSDVSNDSPSVPHLAEQHDWSSSAPSNQMPHVADNTSTRRSPSSSLSNVQSAPSSPEETRNLKEGATLNSKPSLTSPSLRQSTPQTSVRRLSNSADISPYLKKTAEVPTSAKTLQQLALLESVAEESAKMAPLVAARAAAVSRGPVPTPFSMPPNPYPPLPPPSMQNALPVHANYPGPPSSAAGFHPRYPSNEPINMYHDPFQVRSRTSQAFHRPSMHNTTGSVSLNQNHLLATLNGSRGGPISPNYQLPPQFLQQQQQQQPHMFSANMPFYGNPNQAPYHLPPPSMNTFAAVPSGTFPPQPPSIIRPYPTMVPNAVPPMSTVPPNSQSTSSLLSILNSRPTAQSTVPVPAHQ
ncbi:hypothetical protein D9613_001799 [Agrocybe pediades]|uniref:Nudix hydrolase domain-containing protein n=1 Tax=Agrocybe pediades TaxID=84607 RepID=A0A8H4R7R3_9AGAR|nr:hypothetical protein D9613_001799 [Agrocybe pediades]